MTVSPTEGGRRSEGADISQGWKITVIVLAAVGVVSTQLVWLLDSSDAGHLAGALVWALSQHPVTRTDDVAVRTGQARMSERRGHGRGRRQAPARRAEAADQRRH